MSDKIKELDAQIKSLSLGDLLLLTGQAVNMGMDKERVELLLKYLEIALLQRKLGFKQTVSEECLK